MNTPYLIQPKTEQLLEAYGNRVDHIIARLARFHIEFEGIENNNFEYRILIGKWLEDIIVFIDEIEICMQEYETMKRQLTIFYQSWHK